MNIVDYMRDMTDQIGRSMGIREDLLRSEGVRSTARAVAISFEQQRARVFRQRKELEPVVTRIFNDFLITIITPRQPRTADMQTMIDDIHRVEPVPHLRTAEKIEDAKRKVAKSFRDDFDRMRTAGLLR
ncbi:hypothetical protein G6L26_009630 [Agrobacterium radiobacter]|uniref:hypothetical protein n=1 Tax=Agrobacterium tumefaciens complex TaxID=1183400 RepID=UPI00080FA09A|nr:hypothetical protein [Agrobacterium tumefaciens]NTA05445.1 hypothetical protein [Agrobacterium tumefaciens]NTA92038.1 hypothetical protein [Agrobacterium tumefaciens]OCJ32196.1 hypothetical protein A6U90_09780 [Agrobacterium tumefaciens]